MVNGKMMAIGGGGLSAATSIAALSGSLAGAMFAYFTPLPLLAVGLGLGVSMVALAGVAGVALVGIFGGTAAAALYGGIHAFPSWLVVWQALLRRPNAASGQPGWQPIGSVLCLLAMLAGATIDPTETDAAPTEKSEVTVSQLQATKAPLRRPTVATLEHVSTNSGGGVARAYLTSGLRNREPVDKLTSSTGFPSEQGREFFYFTELLGLTGKTVTHRWEHNGRFEGDISFSVRGNRWRVYSSKTITPLQTGTWKVVVSTEEGKVLADTEFVIQRQ